VTANTNFQAATLADQAATALSEARIEGMHATPANSGGNNVYGRLAAPTSTATRASTLGGQATPSAASQLAGCISRVTMPGQSVLLVERANFEGKPATIIVTAPASVGGTSPPKEAEIWALGADCSATTSDVLDHVKVARL
jgi:hypothetical protein